ncbi:MAG: type II toxin-antitoxin system PemK/MazF family toxin [Anaerolineae bacterium]
MKRGEVRWCQFSPPDKLRPAVILTRDSAIGYLSSVSVAPITTSVRRVPSQVVLTEEDGLQTLCAINLYGIQTVRKARIGRLISALSPSKLEELQRAIAFALQLDDLLDG